MRRRPTSRSAEYADLCVKDESCCARTDDLAATIEQTNHNIPERRGFLPIKQGQRPGCGLLRARRVRAEGGPAVRPDDTGLLAFCRRRRPEWVLVPGAARRPGTPAIVHLGEMAALGNTEPRRRPLLLRCRPQHRHDLRQPRPRLHLGRQKPGRRLARAPRRRHSPPSSFSACRSATPWRSSGAWRTTA